MTTCSFWSCLFFHYVDLDPSLLLNCRQKRLMECGGFLYLVRHYSPNLICIWDTTRSKCILITSRKQPSEYHQCWVSDNAFWTHKCTIHHPNTYEHHLLTLFAKLLLVFLDDILIYRKTWLEFMRHLKSVFLLLKQYNLFMKQSKCFFWTSTSVIFGAHGFS